MGENAYIKLREQLDQYSNGFPETASGVELRMLKKLFTEDEAEMYLIMTMMPETAEQAAQRTGRDLEETRALLDRMGEKGLLFRATMKGETMYMVFGFTTGIYEFQLKTFDEEFAKLYEEFYTEAYFQNMRLTPTQHVPIPVHRVVETPHPRPSYEDSREIVKAQKLIAAVDCVCRVQRGLAGGDCDKPVEVCLMFGAHAKYYIERGIGREVSAEEALDILDQCEKAGLVTQPHNSQTPGNICNCCSDCCMYLRSLKQHPKPAEVIQANYEARVDPDACQACETCLDRCQMEAIAMNEAGLAEVNPDRCIGCGLCTTTCPTEAITLEAKPEAARRTPPKTAQDLYMQLSQNRGTSLMPLAMMK
ncbi:MAG: 4Fe-4S binding protein [Proteobacteria bacterium]|nr:4Fe-4S binding protein [Pseudomonadota bacterium]